MLLRLPRSRFAVKGSAFLPVFWLLAALALDLAFSRPSRVVWPGEGRWLAFSDQPHGGRSTARVTPSGSDLTLSIRLDSGVTWPVAGSIFFLDSNGLDVSGPGDLRLRVARTDLSNLTLCLVEDIPGFTRNDRWETARYECLDHEVLPGLQEYRIPFAKFETPSWWYSTAGIRPSTLGPETRSRVLRLVVQNGPGSPLGKDLELRISSLELRPSNLALHLSVWGLGIALFAGHSFLSRRPKKTESVTPSPASDPFFQPVEAVSYADRERDAVVQCIGRDYPDPDLSLEKVARATGVPAERVTHHVKMASGLLFKAYLNKVRGEAARKLLLETDLPIAEISQRVGYGSTPHFNRVFKELFETTPTALREHPSLIGSDPDEV